MIITNQYSSGVIDAIGTDYEPAGSRMAALEVQNMDRNGIWHITAK